LSQVTYREALRRALRQSLDEDDTVFLLGEDIGAYGGSYAVTKGLIAEYGDRIKDTPIAEGGITGFAIGAAMAGMKPIVELMTVNFALLALDQIVNQAAKMHYMFNAQMNVPMVVRTVSGWGQLAATHSQTFDNYFAYVPGLKVVTPATPGDAFGLLKLAIQDPDPVVFIEHSLLYGIQGPVPETDVPMAFGRSVVRRPGRDVTLVSYSRMLQACLAAAETLSHEGIEAEVIDLRCLRPLDLEPVVASVAKTNRVLFAEEGWRSYGIGAEIAARIQEVCFDDLDAPVARIGAKETPLPYNRSLELLAMPSDDDVTALARQLVGKRRVLWPVT
jgi:pyruvate dehydrogenase E1 component beta subunit